MVLPLSSWNGKFKAGVARFKGQVVMPGVMHITGVDPREAWANTVYGPGQLRALMPLRQASSLLFVPLIAIVPKPGVGHVVWVLRRHTCTAKALFR
jgi:hypothetical protein